MRWGQAADGNLNDFLGNSNKLFLFDASKIKIKWILNFFKNIYFFNQIVN
jgi:hypothetical protein